MIRAPRAGELADVAAFIARQQASAATRDAMFDEQADAIAIQLEAWESPWTATSWVAEHGSTLVGFVGAEVDDELGRVWIHGPLAEAPDWDAVAAALLSALESGVPGMADKEAEIAADTENARVAAFATQRGFVAGTVHHLLTIGSAQIQQLSRPVLAPIGAALESAFVALHDEVFPATYYSGRQLLDQAARGDATVLGITESRILVGYAAGRIDEAGDGYLDFVGVAPKARRRGLGATLVVGIAHAFARQREISAMRLTVSGENTAALALYDRLGFERQSSAIGYRRPAERPA